MNDKKYDKTSQGLQLIMIFLDFIIPPQYFIDCDIFLNLLWMLHPCLNFTTLYSMIFVRQFFTFRALRETRLREFISGILMVVSLTVGCIFGSIILVVCGMLYLYPSQFSSPSNVTTECLTESTVSKRMFFFSQTLFTVHTSVIINTTGFGNLGIVLFFCYWTAYPIYKYLR